ncbi:uncharacterized protein LOC101860387 isoform X1 [Aplysia californica]|uniref:Uncharacterized protein LOC101860387 isoform X1 n=2 Tax=Aplysia californica TaxID=6500 RepID=A0ABM1AG56_APLCA|nr:uncharacterized protein LOC101860387 isoform X1 [Aplysia californica]
MPLASLLLSYLLLFYQFLPEGQHLCRLSFTKKVAQSLYKLFVKLKMADVKDVSRQKKYYVKFTKAPFEEDTTHEFKGHRNLSKDDMPWWSMDKKHEKGSRKSVSRNLCGFLNTGMGGTVYCGIVDNGEIHGLKLTQYQRDHIVGAMHDLMSRYSPPVDQRRYKVKFVPVLGASLTEEERLEMSKFDTKEVVNEEERKQPHKYRTPHYCWCDKDMMAQFEHGILISDYVIEYKILPWEPDGEATGGLGSLLNLHPIHADEEGKIYFRRQASLIQYTTSEIANLSRYESNNRCQNIVDGLKKEIARRKSSIALKEMEPKSPHSKSSSSSSVGS